MPPYIYSPLLPGPNSIRMLRLLPNEDEDAPIQCQVFDYSLYESGSRTHLYDALSYVWGSSDTPQSVTIDGFDLPITQNLQVALRRLRDRAIERVIWIDAVCIDQKNDRERGHQVQLMAKIYSRARCVIIFLGEAADNSDLAMEEIRVVASGKLPAMGDDWIETSFLALLNRQWFRRIWVLQEAAAARQILLICGAAEIDGHVFGLGVKKINDCLVRSNSSDRSHPVVELIREATFRIPRESTFSGDVSLDIRPLSELIDLFSAHDATDRRDKVYALLGMSSDDPGAAGLLPDYEIDLEEVFPRLLRFLLSTKVTAKICSKDKSPVITSKGCVLGKVDSIEGSGNNIVARISFTCRVTYMGHQRKTYCDWDLQMSAKTIQKGDIVCLLEGALKPTVLRAHDDHFAVVLIAATPPERICWVDTGKKMETMYWLNYLSLVKVFRRDFRLLWDWEDLPKDVQNQERGGSSMEEFDQSSSLEKRLARMARVLNVAMILEDAEDYERAEHIFQKSIGVYKKGVGEAHPQTLIAMESLAQLYHKRGLQEKTRSLIIEVFRLSKQTRGAQSHETLRLRDNTESFYRHNWPRRRVTAVDEAEMLRLLKQILDDALISSEDLVKVFENFDVDAIGLLLQQSEDKDQVTEEADQIAASDSDRHRIEVTEVLVEAAVRNRGNAVGVFELLLKQRGDEFSITNDLVEFMGKEWSLDPELIRLYIATKVTK